MGALLVPSFALASLADSPHISSEIDTSSCAACHSTHTAVGVNLNRRMNPDGTPADPCNACHDGSLPDAANISTGPIDSFALASGHSYTAPSPGTAKIEGCATCHYTHGSAQDDGRMIPAKTVNGVAVTSAGPQLCLACHTDSASWFGPNYPSTSTPVRDAAGFVVSGTWPGSATYVSAANAHRLLPETTVTVGPGDAQPREQGDCRYCHASHRGPNTYDSLLSTFTVPTDVTLAADKADGSYADLCFRCHGGVKPSGFATAPVDIQIFATSGGSTAGHSIVTAGGLLPVGSPLPCFECHNPHGSSGGNGALLSDERGAALGTTTATGVRAFCFTCHTTAGSSPAGWDSASAAYALVSPTEKVVGIARDGGVLHLSTRDGHAQSDAQSCYECHGNNYSVDGNNVHNPLIPTTVALTALGGAVFGSDTIAPVTTADLSQAFSGLISLVATDVGSGVDVTYFAMDGGGLNIGSQAIAATEGTHTLEYWSADASANVEATNTVLFYVDRTAPVTTLDLVSGYDSSATITLSAADEMGGSGVAATWTRLDGGVETTGTVVTTDAIGAHMIEFWSIDNAGNVELRQAAEFTVTQGLGMLYPFTVPEGSLSAVPRPVSLAL
ncbi:MAG: cytochrome c3 family protein, partial [Actinomycetes bacterium]